MCLWSHKKAETRFLVFNSCLVGRDLGDVSNVADVRKAVKGLNSFLYPTNVKCSGAVACFASGYHPKNDPVRAANFWARSFSCAFESGSVCRRKEVIVLSSQFSKPVPQIKLLLKTKEQTDRTRVFSLLFIWQPWDLQTTSSERQIISQNS